MLEGENWILPKEINANQFFWDSHWLEIWKKQLMALYGPEWRERGYGLWAVTLYIYLCTLYSLPLPADGGGGGVEEDDSQKVWVSF